MLDKLFVTVFRLHRMARSAAVATSRDLLLACYLANTTCAITNIMTTLIFIIVSRSHAFFLVVAVRSFLVLMAVAANCCFQHVEPKCEQGAKARKHFGKHGWFQDNITSLDHEECCYKITCRDAASFRCIFSPNKCVMKTFIHVLVITADQNFGTNYRSPKRNR